MQYRAFLSYSHADRKWARWLHRALESYKPPANAFPDGDGRSRGRLSPIFRDRDELPSTSSLTDAVTEAIRNSEKLILVCSPAAAASHWVNEEVRTFRQLGKSSNILCFIVDGEPGSGDENECFPEALLELDGEGAPAPEPVAADARPQGDGKKNALLKIIAGMLGVGFDVLKQRDLRRRQRRLVAITVGSIAVATVTAVLAITATIARQEADFRRVQAEELVDFMLGDLTERLREIGRLDIYESVSDEALEYFTSQRDANVSDRTLEQWARNLRQIGEVRTDQNDLDAALAAYNESLLITTRLAASNPSNSEAQLGLAFSHFYVGHVHWLRGDVTLARQKFDEQLAIVGRLVESEPANPDWLLELGYAYTNLGRVLELTGDLEAASDAYQKVMSANQRLLMFDPDNDDWQLEVGFAYNNVGKLAIAVGRLDEAERHYRRDLEIKAAVHERNPKHNVWRRYLGVSQYFLGQLLLERGQFEESESLLLAALEHFRFLLAIDSTRNSWIQRAASIERELGRLYLLTDRPNFGDAIVSSAVDSLSALLAGDEDHAGWRRELVRSQIVAAYIAHALGNTSQSSRYLRAVEEHVNLLIEQDPNVKESQELAIRSDIALAELIDNHMADMVLIHSTKAIARLDNYFADSSDPRILRLRAQAYEMTNQQEEAEAIRQRLMTLGLDV